MRWAVFGIAAALFVSVQAGAARSADAEPGYHAKFVISMSLGQEFFSRLAKETGKKPSELDSMGFDIAPTPGNAYFTATKMRTDIEAGGAGMVSSLVDSESREFFLLDHSRRIAWRMDLSEYAKTLGDSGGALLDPERAFSQWDDTLAYLKSIPGAKVRDLGKGTEAGMACRGVRVEARLADTLKAQGVTPLPDMPVLHDLSGNWSGEFWVAEGLQLPLRMKINILGIELTWRTESVDKVADLGPLLRVPPGYRIEPLPTEPPGQPGESTRTQV